MSLIKSRLDISSVSATKKKPGMKYPAFLFSDSSRACSCKRMETKKPEALRQQGWLFLWVAALKGKSRLEGGLILYFLPPFPPKGGLNNAFD